MCSLRALAACNIIWYRAFNQILLVSEDGSPRRAQEGWIFILHLGQKLHGVASKGATLT